MIIKILAFFVAIFLMVILAIFDGFTASKLWEWWIAPLFGIRNISMVEGFALGLIISYYRNPSKGHKLDLNGTIIKDIVVLLIAYGLTFYK